MLRPILKAAVTRLDWEHVALYLRIMLTLQPIDFEANYGMGLLHATGMPPLETALPYLQRARDRIEQANIVVAIESILNSDVPPNQKSLEIGAVLLANGELEFAERVFTHRLQEDNLDWISYAYRGHIRDRRGFDGLADLQNAVALAPEQGLPYYFIGLHYRDIAHDIESGRQMLVKAYFIEPANPAFAAEVAITFQQQGELEQAAEWYNLAVGLAPQEVHWQRLRAVFFTDNAFRLDEFDDSGFAAIEEAYALAPEDIDILTSMGRANYLLNKTTEARVYLQQAFQKEPDNIRVRFYYADLLRREGDREGAIESYLFVRQYSTADSFGVLAERILIQLGEPLP